MFSIYVFGSVLRTAHPRDIDLLVVYESSLVSLRRAAELRSRISQRVAAISSIPADVCLLSAEEDRTTDFSRVVKAKLVYRGDDLELVSILEPLQKIIRASARITPQPCRRTPAVRRLVSD